MDSVFLLSKIIDSDYLWSSKTFKNGAFIQSTWAKTAWYPPGLVEANRRMIFVDASDLDKALTAAPTGTDLTILEGQMQQRAKDLLYAQKATVLTKASVTKQGTHAVYRKDFDIGDVITVHGDYNQVGAMRIAEYAEIEDELGEEGYPTLTLP